VEFSERKEMGLNEQILVCAECKELLLSKQKLDSAERKELRLNKECGFLQGEKMIPDKDKMDYAVRN
jgi:hypothetical protein